MSEKGKPEWVPGEADIPVTRDEQVRRGLDRRLPARAMDRRLETLAASLRLPGFRPGKVPLALARERYGAAAAEEIARAMAHESAAQVVREHGLQPAAPPVIEVAPRAPGEPLRYTLTVELMPEIPAIDPAAMDLERPAVDDPGGLPGERLRELERAWMKRQLLDRLAEICRFPVPSRMLQRELTAIEGAVAAERRRQTRTPGAAPAEAEPGALRALAERRVRLASWCSPSGVATSWWRPGRRWRIKS